MLLLAAVQLHQLATAQRGSLSPSPPPVHHFPFSPPNNGGNSAGQSFGSPTAGPLRQYKYPAAGIEISYPANWPEYNGTIL
jgi:hypothetical protein